MKWKYKDFILTELEELKKPPIVINGLPDVGLVGAIASLFLIRELKMKEVGYIDSDKLLPVLVFHNEKPSMPIRIYEKDGIVAIISEVAIPIEIMPSLAKLIVKWTIKKNGVRVITLGGIPVPNRIDIEKPKVVGAAVLDEDRELLRKYGIEVLKEGYLAGSYALIAKECFKAKLPCITLLAQSHLTYPDPGAAAAVLEKLSLILGVKINVKPLLEEAEEVRLKLRELMKKTLPMVKEAQKGYEYTTPLMYA